MVLALGAWAFSLTGASWWWFAGLFLAPDLAMLAYLVNLRVGAAAYNAAHTYVGPAVVAAVAASGVFSAGWWLAAIWSAHIGFDRLLGYGLKYTTGFKDTHLGRV